MNTSNNIILKQQIIKIAQELGFLLIKITDTNLFSQKNRLKEWLDKKYYGNMEYLLQHHDKRLSPEELFPGTKSIICVAMTYEKIHNEDYHSKIDINLQQANEKIIASYAKGHDYHKFIRKKLQKFADEITKITGPFSHRAFTGSAPILEKALAEKSGIGSVGKNSLIINKDFGSYIFLGELFTNLDLLNDTATEDLCKYCSRCIKSCPTKALEQPYILNASKCIAYFTIEYQDVIPEHIRPLIGTYIFGCEICQKICPWNRNIFLKQKVKKHTNIYIELIKYFLFTKEEFLAFTKNSPIARISYDIWLRNIAIALGNCENNAKIINALKMRYENASELVKIHIQWALNKHGCKF